MCKNKILVVTIILNFISTQICAGATESFSESFLTSYDFSGRYTHEYHPFILKKTRESFLKLEQYLIESGFSIEGRKLILGYQEDAVLPYETDWSREAIEDEVMVKTHAGLSAPTKNIFGFMTGFLLKDAEWLEKSWFKNSETSVSHIVARPLEIFNDNGVIFQKHAFGKDFDFILKAQNSIEKAVFKQDLKVILEQMIRWWCALYEHNFKTGSEEVVGTQDMLFSIDYARALVAGKTPLKKLFVGPDITYPIEVLTCQKREATAHAQKFLNILGPDLKAHDSKKTAYIFCSFVDGVGKSTLFNNIMNHQKFGSQVEKYERCDNSSSQEATLYNLKDNVYLVDLPAQISHFAIKPDGYVFVDIQTIKECSAEFKDTLRAYINKNKIELIKKFLELKEKVASENRSLYDYDDPQMQYAHNCHILEVQDNKWVPLVYENKNYLFNQEDPSVIRILVPLAGVHSIGLKVVEPESMLFSKGLSLPMKYEIFLEDLRNKLKSAGIEHIYFVDFLSMYPRTSRENIRVNFILQYLKRIFGNYNIQNSFYKHRINHEQEICHLLCTKFEAACQLLVNETALRWAFFKLLEEVPLNAVSAISGKQLEELLHSYTQTILDTHKSQITKDAQKRLLPEREIYYKKYGLDRTYENIVRFTTEPLMAFSKLLTSFWMTKINNNYFANLWAGLDDIFKFSLGPIGDKQNLIILPNGQQLEIKYRVHSLCRDEEVLGPVIREIRAQLYAQLANLLKATVSKDGYEFKSVTQYVPPLILKQESDGYLYVLQKRLPLVDMTSLGDKKLVAPLKYHLLDHPKRKRRWGVFGEAPHCLEWDNPGTFFGIYAYGYYLFKTPKNTVTQLLDKYRADCIKSDNPHFGMPTSELYKQIIIQKKFSALQDDINNEVKSPIEFIEPDDPRVQIIALWVRLMATLDMILKDPKTEIFIRKGNKEDFMAALKLLEKITLPVFFGIQCKGPLFDDYTEVEPVISWDLIK